MLIVLRPFKTGRKIHAYDMSLENPGSLIYTIDLDEPSLKLMKTPGYVSYDIHRNFFCALDDDKILIWNSRNGKFLREIPISPHYEPFALRIPIEIGQNIKVKFQINKLKLMEQLWKLKFHYFDQKLRLPRKPMIK